MVLAFRDSWVDDRNVSERRSNYGDEMGRSAATCCYAPSRSTLRRQSATGRRSFAPGMVRAASSMGHHG